MGAVVVEVVEFNVEASAVGNVRSVGSEEKEDGAVSEGECDDVETLALPGHVNERNGKRGYGKEEMRKGRRS